MRFRGGASRLLEGDEFSCQINTGLPTLQESAVNLIPVAGNQNQCKDIRQCSWGCWNGFVCKESGTGAAAKAARRVSDWSVGRVVGEK